MQKDLMKLIASMTEEGVSSTEEFIDYAKAKGIDLEDPFFAGFLSFSKEIDKYIEEGMTEEKAVDRTCANFFKEEV